MSLSFLRCPTLDRTRARNFALTACLLSVCLLAAGCSDGNSESDSGDGATDAGTDTTDAGTDEATTGNPTDTPDETTAPAIATGLRINEIVASNQTGLADEDGDMSDYIELFNPSVLALDLTGWHLSDDPEDLTKWTFPPQSLSADSYLIVFASDKDRATAGAQLHTNFRLTADGEFLALSNPAATVVVDEFAPAFPALMEDQAYGVRSDGTVDILSAPTPGAANTP